MSLVRLSDAAGRAGDETTGSNMNASLARDQRNTRHREMLYAYVWSVNRCFFGVTEWKLMQ